MKKDSAFSADDFVFVDAAILGRDDYVFLAHHEASLQAKRYRLHILRRTNDTWSVSSPWRWEGVGFTVQALNPLRIFAIGRDGQVGAFVDGDVQEEHVAPKSPVGPFRGIQAISEKVLAYGMKREIFRRETTGAWQKFDKGMAQPLPKGKVDVSALIKQRIKDIGGINALAYTDPQRLFAFGMRGEIWRLRSDAWHKVDSPTNLMLQDAVAAGSETIYVCGQLGTILRGSGDEWESVEYSGPPRLYFCSVAFFQDHLFLADGHSARRLDDGELKVVNFGGDEIVPSFSLSSSFGQILSIAGQEAWVSRDGDTWESLLG
jgi:hypothetical protein